MKRFIGLLTAMTLMVLWTAPVLAAGLSISPPTVEFDVTPGMTKAGPFVYVANTGTVTVIIDTSIEDESHVGVYADGLVLAGSPVGTWVSGPILPSNDTAARLMLTVPAGTPPGTYTATLVFWAEAAPTP